MNSSFLESLSFLSCEYLNILHLKLATYSDSLFNLIFEVKLSLENLFYLIKLARKRSNPSLFQIASQLISMSFRLTLVQAMS